MLNQNRLFIEMKTKLLKKIRKQYKVTYFERGSQVYDIGTYDFDVYHVTEFNGDPGLFFGSKQLALDWILKQVRIKYGRKKVNNKGVKVWYVN